MRYGTSYWKKESRRTAAGKTILLYDIIKRQMTIKA